MHRRVDQCECIRWSRWHMEPGVGAIFDRYQYSGQRVFHILCRRQQSGIRVASRGFVWRHVHQFVTHRIGCHVYCHTHCGVHRSTADDDMDILDCEMLGRRHRWLFRIGSVHESVVHLSADTYGHQQCIHNVDDKRSSSGAHTVDVLWFNVLPSELHDRVRHPFVSMS